MDVVHWNLELFNEERMGVGQGLPQVAPKTVLGHEMGNRMSGVTDVAPGKICGECSCGHNLRV